MNNLQSLSFFYPELILTSVIILSIIYDLFLKKEKSGQTGLVMIIGLIIVALAIWFQDNKTTTLFSDAIVLDPFSTFFKYLISFGQILKFL